MPRKERTRMRWFTEDYFLQKAKEMEMEEELDVDLEDDAPSEPGDDVPSGYDYSEVADQLFNLVDNNKTKVDAFYAMKSNGLQREEVQGWIRNNVKTEELTDLYREGGNTEGFVDWISANPDYFNPDTDTCLSNDDETEVELDDSSEEDDIPEPDTEQIAKDIETEDDALMADEEDDDSSEDEQECHRFRIYLKHIKPVRNEFKDKVDKDEAVEKQVHKKYYILTKNELGTQDMLDDLEDELDKTSHTTYYDFPNVSLKIYHQNEVELNRIFESLGLECRCKDIAHYTDEDERKRLEGQRNR